MSWAKRRFESTLFFVRVCLSRFSFFDLYSCHVSSITFSLIGDNPIAADEITHHTSHDLQYLDVTIFGTLQEKCRRRFSCTMTTKKG